MQRDLFNRCRLIAGPGVRPASKPRTRKPPRVQKPRKEDLFGAWREAARFDAWLLPFLNVYLMAGHQEETLDIYGRDIIPSFAAASA